MTERIGTIAPADAAVLAPVRQRNLWLDAGRRLLRNRLALIGLFVVGLLVFLAVFGRMLAPQGYNEQVLRRDAVDQPPSLRHLFGTDDFGRDVFSRVLWGARTALMVGLVVQGIELAFGLSVGALAGYYGGWLDNLLMRVTDIMFAFPGLLFAIMVVAVLGPGLFNVFVALGLVGWPGMARLVRGQVLSVKAHEYVEGARAVGASDARLLLQHIIPNCLGPVIVSVSLGMGGAILAESSLSFLGIGVQAPHPSWGSMINEAMTSWRTYPYLAIIPGLIIAVVVLAFNFVGDGLNDALNPRSRRV